MKINMNVFITLSLFSFAILMGSCSGEHRETKEAIAPIAVRLASPKVHEGRYVQASGKIVPKETATISTRVMGFVTGIYGKTGDRVKKGTLLVTISDNDIKAKRAQAQAMVAEAEAALKDAKKDHERFQELLAKQSASVKEFENATLNYNSIKAKAEAAHQMLAEAESMLRYTNITAPFDGVITQQVIDVGNIANPGMPILVLEQTGGYEVIASVSEEDMISIKSGASAEITVKSTDQVLAGKVIEVSPSSQMSGGQYVIKMNIPNTEKAPIYSGMYVQVRIPVAQVASLNSVFVPASAILRNDQLTGLYTVTENKTALLRWVRLGKVRGEEVEILSGLNNNEQFVIDSEGKLYNGAPVVIQQNLTSR